MIEWIKKVLTRYRTGNKIDARKEAFEAEESRIKKLTVVEARKEIIERLDDSQADIEFALTASGFDSLDLTSDVIDIFNRYNWITFSWDDFRIDRALVRIAANNPDFVIIGSTVDGDDVCVMRGRFGLFYSVPKAPYVFLPHHAAPQSFYHALLSYMYVYR